MQINGRSIIFAVLALAILGSSGCVLPTTEHPLSNEKTSKLDERLLGTWQPQKEKGKPVKKNEILVVRRSKDRPNTLIVEQLHPDGDGEETEQLVLYTTKVDGRNYMSFGDPKKKEYFILLYEVPDADTGRMYMLDNDAIVTAIETGKLAGKVVREKPAAGEKPAADAKPKLKKIHITASPKELAKYLKANSPGCFSRENPGVYLRIKES